MYEKAYYSMNTKNLLKNKYVWIIVGIILLVIISSVGEEQLVPIATQPQIKNIQQETQVKELTLEQKLVRDFLVKELELDDELQRGNNEVANAGREFDYGVPLPYIIRAELVFEKVLEKSKALVVPSGGEKVKTYLIEATNNALSGVKKIREGLESYPVDKIKLGQGIEMYTKSQMSLARKNAEIDKLKQETRL
ncbi:MAG: hypothetical protein UX81_C0005G0042 [Parcubacteria group bacterium GW2011_GWA2_47_12]|nr:MAG: hypothetical protein UX81_C0005G0042 [Parcubacteria group bacterium GW2011_GWA2_47_12]